REAGGEGAVHLLLLGDGGPRKVDQRGSVDVDVEDSGGEGLDDERLDRRSLRVGGGPELFRVGLVVIALQEDGTPPTLAQRGAQDHGRILGWPLERVADLRARKLEHERRGTARLRRAEGGADGVVGDAADVEGRDGEARALSPPAGQVEVED